MIPCSSHYKINQSCFFAFLKPGTPKRNHRPMPMHTADTSRIMENHMSSLNLGAHWIFAAQLRGTWTEHGLELLQELWGLPKSLTCSPIPDSQGYEEIDNVHHCLSPNRTPGNNWWSSEIVNTPCFAEQMSCPWNLYCVSPYDGCVV